MRRCLSFEFVSMFVSRRLRAQPSESCKVKVKWSAIPLDDLMMTWGYPDIFGKLHTWSIFGSAQKMCICCWLAGDFRKKHGGSDVGTWAATSTRSQQVG